MAAQPNYPATFWDHDDIKVTDKTLNQQIAIKRDGDSISLVVDSLSLDSTSEMFADYKYYPTDPEELRRKAIGARAYYREVAALLRQAKARKRAKAAKVQRKRNRK